MSSKLVKCEGIPWILQELPDEIRENNNTETFYESESDLSKLHQQGF